MMEASMAKMTCKLSLLVALFFFLTLSLAWAADGNELLRFCEHGPPEYGPSEWGVDRVQLIHYGYCMGTISSVSTVMVFLQSKLPKAIQVCCPDEVSLGQKRLIVVKYLRDHPEQLHFAEAWLVHAALNEAFPCK